MPREAAAARLTALIDALPRGQPSGVPSRPSAADLVALLPNGKSPSPETSDNASGAAASRKTPMLIGLGALVLMILVVFEVSTLFSSRPDPGADPLAPSAAEVHKRRGAATAWPLKLESSAAAFFRVC